MCFLKVFVNGDLQEEVKGQGLLSLDWGGKAGIGMDPRYSNMSTVESNARKYK